MPQNPGLWSKNNAQSAFSAFYSFLVHHAALRLCAGFFVFLKRIDGTPDPSLPISAERRERSRPWCAFPGERLPSPLLARLPLHVDCYPQILRAWRR